MNRKREKPGLTLVEILTVIAIIALLIGILIPAVTAVKDAAKEVKQTAQFTTIELGLTAFKTDYGDYPPSYYGHNPPLTGSRTGIYCGSHKMTEALLGWDLLGFHPDSDWCWDGFDAAGGAFTYDPRKVRVPPGATLSATFDERKQPYLESGTQYAFTLSDLFGSIPGFPAVGGVDAYVLCDVFATKVARPDGSSVKAGAPILYYKADPSGKFNDSTLAPTMTSLDNKGNIYNYWDNEDIVRFKEAKDGASVPAFSVYTTFYEYIRDPKITAKPTPYNPSSYILISAGKDGTYGTPDDIRNFGD